MNVNYNFKAGRAYCCCMCVGTTGAGQAEKAFVGFFYTGRGMKIPQINTKYFPHKKIKFKEGP